MEGPRRNEKQDMVLHTSKAAEPLLQCTSDMYPPNMLRANSALLSLQACQASHCNRTPSIACCCHQQLGQQQKGMEGENEYVLGRASRPPPPPGRGWVSPLSDPTSLTQISRPTGGAYLEKEQSPVNVAVKCLHHFQRDQEVMTSDWQCWGNTLVPSPTGCLQHL